MNERMYWGLLGFVFLWLVLSLVRRCIFLRMKITVRDLLHRERVAAIAKGRTDLPPADPEFAEEFPVSPFIKQYGEDKLLFLSGIILLVGGAGVGFDEISWVPSLLGLGIIVGYFATKGKRT
jgi:hypothetical protein